MPSSESRDSDGFLSILTPNFSSTSCFTPVCTSPAPPSAMALTTSCSRSDLLINFLKPPDDEDEYEDEDGDETRRPAPALAPPAITAAAAGLQGRVGNETVANFRNPGAQGSVVCALRTGCCGEKQRQTLEEDDDKRSAIAMGAKQFLQLLCTSR